MKAMKSPKRYPVGKVRELHEWKKPDGADLTSKDFPHSGNTGEFNVHTKGYTPDGKKHEFHIGKAKYTLYLNLGPVRSRKDVENQARLIYATFSDTFKEEQNKKRKEIQESIIANQEK